VCASPTARQGEAARRARLQAIAESEGDLSVEQVERLVEGVVVQWRAFPTWGDGDLDNRQGAV
jgi:hypothetical protein